MDTKVLFHFIKERHAIYERRRSGMPKPWTKDPILQAYRFCNVYRELDKVTVWIRENWRHPNREKPHVWFNMVVARLLNHPETLAEVAYTNEKWRPNWFLDPIHSRQERGLKIFSSAYIVSTNGKTMPKPEYLVEYVLGPLWNDRKIVMPRQGELLQEFHERLMAYDGMGSFMAAQVIADTKYTALCNMAPDWWTFAASGPGSRRGLNHVMGRPLDAPWREPDWREALVELQKKVDPYVERLRYPRLHAQDLQNCMCEVGKIVKVISGEGRPRQNYPGAA